MNDSNVAIHSNNPARVISVPDVIQNKKWTGCTRLQAEEQIVSCYNIWKANGQPKLLDSFMPQMVLGLKPNHSKFKEYGFIGRKMLLSMVRRYFTRNDSVKINHFLLFKNNGLERIDHFFTTLLYGMLNSNQSFNINHIQGVAKGTIGDLVLYEDFLNTQLWSENKQASMLADRMLVVDCRFNTEDLAYRKPTRLKDFRNFLFNSKDLKRDTKSISMHYTNRSFYFAGVTWERNFLDSYRKMFNDAKVANMAYPLIIDLMLYNEQEKLEYQGRKYINLQSLYQNVPNIIGEAYARAVLGEDIPKLAFTSLNGQELKDYEALAYFDGHYVENWNVVQKDNTNGIPIFEL
jgi:hypothetical protein